MKKNILTIISAVMAILALCSILFVYGCVKSDNETPTVSTINLDTKPVTEPATEAPDEGVTEAPTELEMGTAVDSN